MFVGRDQVGGIYGLWTVRQWDRQEELPEDNPEVVAFVNRPAPPKQPTADELKVALLKKGVLTEADVAAVTLPALL